MKTLETLLATPPAELRVALAVALGLCVHPFENWEKCWSEDETYDLKCGICRQYLYNSLLPDWPSDLNAVAEVELTLCTNDDDPSTRERFRIYLDMVCQGNPHIVHASARQRTIALLLVLQSTTL